MHYKFPFETHAHWFNISFMHSRLIICWICFSLCNCGFDAIFVFNTATEALSVLDCLPGHRGNRNESVEIFRTQRMGANGVVWQRMGQWQLGECLPLYTVSSRFQCWSFGTFFCCCWFAESEVDSKNSAVRSSKWIC